jgi:hypothetical protein
MSTTPTETTPPAAAPATPPAAPTPAPPAQATPAEPATPPAQEADELSQLKAEARKWEQRAKENFEKAKKFDDLEEASKTEAQKQADALTKAQSELNEYKQREQVAAWAKEVSTETGVPADLLRGSTKEELTAHATQLKPLIGTQQEQPPGVVSTIGKTPQTPANIPLGQQIAAAEAEAAKHAYGTPERRDANSRVMGLKALLLTEAHDGAKR